jgi:hypothetical protein
VLFLSARLAHLPRRWLYTSDRVFTIPMLLCGWRRKYFGLKLRDCLFCSEYFDYRLHSLVCFALHCEFALCPWQICLYDFPNPNHEEHFPHEVKKCQHYHPNPFLVVLGIYGCFFFSEWFSLYPNKSMKTVIDAHRSSKNNLQHNFPYYMGEFFIFDCLLYVECKKHQWVVWYVAVCFFVFTFALLCRYLYVGHDHAYVVDM